jgi:chromosome segregation ATPase
MSDYQGIDRMQYPELKGLVYHAGPPLTFDDLITTFQSSLFEKRLSQIERTTAMAEIPMDKLKRMVLAQARVIADLMAGEYGPLAEERAQLERENRDLHSQIESGRAQNKKFADARDELSHWKAMNEPQLNALKAQLAQANKDAREYSEKARTADAAYARETMRVQELTAHNEELERALLKATGKRTLKTALAAVTPKQKPAKIEVKAHARRSRKKGAKANADQEGLLAGGEERGDQGDQSRAPGVEAKPKGRRRNQRGVSEQPQAEAQPAVAAEAVSEPTSDGSVRGALTDLGYMEDTGEAGVMHPED